VKGVILTGEHGREGPMIGEILNSFKYFVDLFYPHLSGSSTVIKPEEEENNQEEEEKTTDVGSANTSEGTVKTETTTEAKRKLFEVYNSGCSGIAIISFVPEELNPVEFVARMLTHVVEGNEPKPKFTIEHTNRVVPLEAIFEMTSINSIVEAAKPILDLHFKDKPETTFALRVEHRNFADFKKMDCIDAVAPLVIAHNHKVDLDNPDKVVMVQVFKSAAGIAVLPDYEKLHKYNIKEAFKTLQPASTTAASTGSTTTTAKEEEGKKEKGKNIPV